jgi:hypothetical protein
VDECRKRGCSLAEFEAKVLDLYDAFVGTLMEVLQDEEVVKTWTEAQADSAMRRLTDMRSALAKFRTT